MQKVFLKFFVPFLPIVLLLLWSNTGNSQCSEQAIFERISVEQGLSQGTVNSFCQDYNGFLWIATNSGLNRYDGINFKHFVTNPFDTSSVSSNIITVIFEDSKQRLWIGTRDAGLNLYNHKTETFTRVKHNLKDRKSITQDRIYDINEDLQGNLWIAFMGGLSKLDPNKDEFVTYTNTGNAPNVVPSNQILNVKITGKGDVFISTDRGIAYYNAREDIFTPLNITLQPHNVSLSNLVVNSLVVDLNDDIWFGPVGYGLYKYSTGSGKTEWYGQDVKSIEVYDLYKAANGDIWIGSINGVYKYDWQTLEFSAFKNDPYNPNSISSNIITSIFEDKQGIIWVGVYGLGINKYNPKKSNFCAELNLSSKLFDFPTLTAKSFYEDGDDIWIGTYGEGAIRVSYSNSTLLQLKHIKGDSNSLPDDYVYQITKTPDSTLWFATFNGIASYDSKTRVFKNFKHNPDDPNSLPANPISGLFLDSKGTLWYRAFEDYFGKLNPDGESFLNYSISELDTTVGLDVASISEFYEDDKGIFWMGTADRGVYLFNPDKEAFIDNFVVDDDNPESICSNKVLCFYQDTHNNLWIGTDNGLCLFNAESHTFTNIPNECVLPNSSISSIQEDGKGYYWISTQNGLSRVDLSDIKNPVFRNFNTFDGLKNEEFLQSASFKDQRGYLYFSGYNNLNVFNPADIFVNNVPPPVYINKVSVSQGNRSKTEKLEYGYYTKNDTVTFPSSYSNFIFRYTAIEFYQPEKIKFRYKLEGFDNEWINPIDSKQRYISYTNLNPGTYTFKVIAANSDGVWNQDGDTFHFTIRPPFWRTWWFFVLISLFFASFILAFIRFREANLVKAKIKLEELVKERTAEISDQSEELKMQSEFLKHANEEISATSTALADQNKQFKQKNEEITIKNKELEEQKNSLANIAWELQDKNEEITAQRNEIERQKKEITDSILYAYRIQQAVLPTQDQVKDLFSDFFVFNRPKSIVSGDFYWATRVGNYRVVAVVDCTGHGVPGGFMSMLGVLMLNEVVLLRGIIDPAKALNQLRQGIISVLHQKGEFTDAADGMDLSLCIIDDTDNTLTYSGANSSMAIFEPLSSTNNESLTVVRSDRMPIAYHPLMKSFSNQKFSLSGDSVIFLFTDGVIDQFGGAKNKKFQHQRLMDFILENKDLPLETQGIVLEQTFDHWKGSTYQVDDVLVMGLKV
ncbi:MAG: two-component regulator propeller domain-containing protein [Tenuifilaceae bacterium]|nr:two-component regulator propeller domain-containing protein [Tenuifilaceae bacterium]